MRLKESKISGVDVELRMQNVLIIDIGSSTTDFTIVSRMGARPIEEFGLSLGAGLIEEMIFERTLFRMEKENRADLQRLEDVFQNYPHFKRQCLIACCEGKEKYFSILELSPRQTSLWIAASNSGPSNPLLNLSQVSTGMKWRRYSPFP